MKTKLISLAIAVLLVFTYGQAYGEQACKTIMQTGPATVSSQDCYASGVLGKLNASGQFPEVFADKKYIFPGLPAFLPNTVCFASDGSFSASIGGVPVSVQTFSVWTNTTKPLIFSLRGLTDAVYKDTQGEVITQFTISDPTGRYSGKIFSRDVIDLGRLVEPSIVEKNAIVGGTQRFFRAKGSFQMRLDTMPTPPATVPISKLNGMICAGTEASRINVIDS